MRSRDDDPVLRRLGVPASLAVAFVGSAAAVTMWYGGCDPNEPEPNPDAGTIEVVKDAVPVDGLDAEAPADAAPDATIADAAVDTAPPDTPPV